MGEDVIVTSRPSFSTPIAALPDRATLRSELLLVLLLSIGAAGIRGIVSILDLLTRQEKLSDQTAVIIGTYAPDRPWLDLLYQLTNIGLALVPVFLVAHFLSRSGEGLATIGFDSAEPLRDVLRGLALAALVGGVGLVFYVIAFRLGANVRVAAAVPISAWWTIPLLLLTAAYNAILEEVITAGYLLHRLDQLGVRPRVAVVFGAVLRGSYHLYQGFGGFVGNIAMGLLFGWLFRRWGRIMPMLVAHFLIDAVAFLGYYALAGRVDWLP